MYLVSGHLTGFLIDGELCSLLIGLLDDGVFDLSVDSLVRVSGLNLDNGTPVRCTLLNLRRVFRAFLEDRLVVVDICYENDHYGGARVDVLLAVRATSSVIESGDVKLVLVPVEGDLLAVQTDDTGYLLYHELTGNRLVADEAETHVVAILVGSDNGRHQSIRTGVLVNVRSVDLLREFRLLVVLVFRVDSHRRGAALGRIAWSKKGIICDTVIYIPVNGSL